MARSTKSARRQYRLGRRGEAAEETRRRVVEATYELHAEQGIADTTMKQIAERAGVSVGTVYHHFPTYAEVVEACGAYATAHVPAPTEAIFDGAASRAERIERLARAAFEYYERLPVLASVRRDRHAVPVLQKFADEEERGRLRLAALALDASETDPRNALVAALVDLDVHRAMRRQGFRTADAAARVAALLNAWLDSGGHGMNE